MPRALSAAPVLLGALFFAIGERAACPRAAAAEQEAWFPHARAPAAPCRSLQAPSLLFPQRAMTQALAAGATSVQLMECVATSATLDLS